MFDEHKILIDKYRGYPYVIGSMFAFGSYVTYIVAKMLFKETISFRKFAFLCLPLVIIALNVYIIVTNSRASVYNFDFRYLDLAFAFIGIAFAGTISTIVKMSS
jgi:hypothetical protein